MGKTLKPIINSPSPSLRVYLFQIQVQILIVILISNNCSAIGVNWGTASSNPLPPQKVVELLKSNGINKVKLFDANPFVLESLSGSNIRVTVAIPNSMLRTLNSSLKAAQNWVHDNLTRFLSDGPNSVHIDYIAVGDEPFLQSYGDQFHPFVVKAAVNVQTALSKANLAQRVKVVVPCSFDSFHSDSGLPSKARFRPDINRTMIELLTFLNRHQAPFFVTISPFNTFQENKNISLDFSLFRLSARPKNDTHKTYKNSFDLSYDSVAMSLSNSGFSQLDIIVGRVGWPTDGAPNATSPLAQEFMKGLVNHLHNKPKSQTLPSETYVFSLLDEDNRSTASGNFERHWGLFTFDGQAKYQADFDRSSRHLVNAQGVQYLSSKWCVVNDNKDLSNATVLAREACLNADCTDLSRGGSCFNLSWPANISFAFNSFYQQHDQNAVSCDFGGLGLITTVDPSHDTCRFAVGLRTSVSVSLRRYLMFHCMIPPMITVLCLLLSERW